MTTTTLQRIRAAGLTGRGGAAFPTYHKLSSAIGSRPRLIINLVESEPDSIKDRWILMNDVGPLLEGISAVADLLQADGIWLAAHAGSAIEAVLHRDPRLSNAGYQLLIAPGRYVAGQASSLVSLLDGGSARPIDHRQPLSIGDRSHWPTVVMNAETVYWIGQLERHGEEWFRTFGFPSEPGLRLVTIADGDRRQVLTAAAGTPILDLVLAAGMDWPQGGYLQLGGLGGEWLTADQAIDLNWSDADLAAYGLTIGASVIRTLTADRCPLLTVAAQLDFLARESAGQCGPCMFGLPAIAADWRELIMGSADADQRLRRRIGLLPGRGACHHPDGAARNARTALIAMAHHLDQHRNRTCVKQLVRAA